MLMFITGALSGMISLYIISSYQRYKTFNGKTEKELLIWFATNIRGYARKQQIGGGKMKLQEITLTLKVEGIDEAIEKAKELQELLDNLTIKVTG